MDSCDELGMQRGVMEVQDPRSLRLLCSGILCLNLHSTSCGTCANMWDKFTVHNDEIEDLFGNRAGCN